MPNNKQAKFPALNKDLAVDVAVIGGGLCGVSTAYFLSRSGLRVALLEARTLGSGATAETTAFLTQVIDTGIADLKNMFGKEKTELVWESHGQAIETVGQVAAREGIECEYGRCSNFYYANSEKEFKVLEKEYDTAKSMGFNVSLHKVNELPFHNEGYLEVFDQGKFKAREYLNGLARAAKTYGAKIFENTAVEDFKRQDDGRWAVSTNKRGNVLAKDIIIATYYPLTNPKATFLKKGMYVTYVLEAKIPKGLVPYAIYEDTANPYNYFRVDEYDKKFDAMTIGGQDHRAEIKMDPKKSYNALEQYLRKIFPDMEYEIVSRWAGPILEPSDGLALIGQTLEHQYVATAFSGNGMTYSTIAAMLLCDLVDGQVNLWQELYDPKRIPSIKQLAKKGLDYTQEMFSGALKNAFK